MPVKKGSAKFHLTSTQNTTEWNSPLQVDESSVRPAVSGAPFTGRLLTSFEARGFSLPCDTRSKWLEMDRHRDIGGMTPNNGMSRI